jgi:hypothetical protein
MRHSRYLHCVVPCVAVRAAQAPTGFEQLFEHASNLH